MTARNDITGDLIRSASTKKYLSNYDSIKFSDKSRDELVTHVCSDGLKKMTIVGNECKTCKETFNGAE